MMLNYVKAEFYRVARGKEAYLTCGILCALVVAANATLAAFGASDPYFSYNTARFSFSNLISMLTLTFAIGAILAFVLYGDDRKNGTLKNALMHGCSRASVFAGKCLVTCAAGLVCMVVVYVVYVASAVLLLEGPVLEPALWMAQGLAVALPSTVAATVAALLAAELFSASPTVGAVVWGVVAIAVPRLLQAIGMKVDALGVFASWLPTNFLQNEVLINMSGAAQFLWQTPAGLVKCLVAGFACLALAVAAGVWQARRTEL